MGHLSELVVWEHSRSEARKLDMPRRLRYHGTIPQVCESVRLLSLYLSQAILRRTGGYLLLCMLFFSLIEAIERQFSLPISLGVVNAGMLWVLSWPFYTALMLPGCYFAGIVTTLLHGCKTNEYPMFMALGWSNMARLRVIMLHATMVALVVAFLNGWLLPQSQVAQWDKVNDIIATQWLPHFKPGQFNSMAMGGKKMLVYPATQQRGSPSQIPEATFVIESNPNTGEETLYTVQSLQHLIQPDHMVLQFKKGIAYSFAHNTLRKALQFTQMAIPLEGVGKRLLLEDNETKDSLTLWQSDKQADHNLLWWRVNNAIATAVLALVAMMITPYYFCQQRPRAVMVEAMLLYLGYFFLLVLAKTQSGIYPAWQTSYYLAAHGGVLGCAWLIRSGINARVLRCY